MSEAVWLAIIGLLGLIAGYIYGYVMACRKNNKHKN